MISWWWLVVEAALWILLLSFSVPSVRTMALLDALSDPVRARFEILRRWKMAAEPAGQEVLDEAILAHSYSRSISLL